MMHPDTLTPTTTGPQGAFMRRAIEPVLAGIAGWLFYTSLHGELPYHDVIKFALQIQTDRYLWDIGHILLQPAALLWHRYLGFGQHAINSQEQLHALATAVALAFFHATLLRLRLPLWQRIAGTVLLATSCGIIILAPSGHVKMLGFPFVNAALYYAVMWEMRARANPMGMAVDRALLLSAFLLGMAASFLVSSLAVAPFAAIAILVMLRRAGASWLRGLLVSGVFSVVCGGVFLFWVCFGLVYFGDMPISIDSFIGSIVHKADHQRAVFFLTVRAARLVFGTANTMIAAQDFGPVVRAWLSGYDPSWRAHAWMLIWQGLPWLAAAILIAAIYLRTAVATLRGAACLMPLSWLLGATAWTIYYNLNDPEHWFQLSAPTILLFLILFSARTRAIILPVWLALALVLNVALLAVPQARYPLTRYQADMRALLKPNDLVIAFGDYGGGAHYEFINPHTAPLIMPDRVFMQNGSVAVVLDMMEREINRVLAAGGKVYVFDILDPDNWHGPWDQIAGRGLTKKRMFDFFAQRYHAEPLGLIAEIPAWNLTRK